MKRLAVLTLILLPSLLFAEEAPVYESLDSVRIGPVFLTPEQRRWLDARRGEAPDDGSIAQDNEASEQSENSGHKRKPAGFIISSNGKRSQWNAGDFERTTATTVSEMSFPDDVTIIRHSRPGTQPDDDDENRE